MCDSLLEQLKSLVNQIDDGCPKPKCCPSPCPAPCPAPCPVPCSPVSGCPPCPYPYVQVCMMCPPPCPAPTAPKYVKPLTLPNCCPPSSTNARDPERDNQTRYSNFYNNYNVDYHTIPSGNCGSNQGGKDGYRNEVTVDGKNPRCEDYTKKKSDDCESAGCPTGFKPCSMKLCPPPCCDPLGTWKAAIQPCPPKSRKRVSTHYTPGKCTRPCCKHWKPKGGACLYDQPCKAHCYDHPPRIIPSLKS